MFRQEDENHPLLTMPKVVYADHLISYMLDISVGETGISWQDIKAYIGSTGVRLSHWEQKTIRKLATEYVVQFNRSSDVGANPPHVEKGADQDYLNKKFDAVFK